MERALRYILFHLLSSCRIEVFPYLRLCLYYYYFRSMQANLNASERYGVLKLILSNISSDFLNIIIVNIRFKFL